MTEKQAKIIFPLVQDEDGYPPFDSESLWVSVGENKNEGRLENIPFFAGNVAYGDIVRVEKESDGACVFNSVVQRSKHSTVRVILLSDAPEVEHRLKQGLRTVGCSWEKSNSSSLFAVDVPPAVKISNLLNFLNQGEDAERWEYEEAYLSTWE